MSDRVPPTATAPRVQMSPSLIFADVMRRPTSALVMRLLRSPIVYPLGLAIVAIAIYHFWFTSLPLSAADWPWIPDDQLRTWFPWPTLWEPEIGFGLMNFAGIYETPIEAVGGILAQASANWALVEKVLYFVPFAVLSFVGPWILAREVMRSQRWAVLSAVIFGTSTYFITFSVGGQMYLAVAEALAPIVLFAAIRSLRRLSVKWALGTGLLMGLQAAYEVRVTYLTVLLCLLYGAVLIGAEPGRRFVMRRVSLLAIAFGVLAGTQLYWLLPFLTYHGDRRLPIAVAPWLAFMRLTHGVTSVAPGWTGSTPATFQYVPVNPVFFALPIVAYLTLMARRISAELLWLCLSALAAAFFIKQTNPPAGGIYQWMFLHIPGWNLFREGSKFYFVVGIAYAILVPVVLREGFNLAQRLPARYHSMSRIGAGASVLAIACLSVANLIPLETGQVGFTSHPIAEPTAVKNLSSVLDADPTYGAVLWMAAAWFTDKSGPDPQFLQDHNFVTRSVRHPVVELLGGVDNGDPLTPFCRAPKTPFCYVESQQLLKYLLQRTGTRYVVAPASPMVGRFEVNTNYQALLYRLTSDLGVPEILGDRTGALAVWRIAGEVAPIVAAPAITMVDGGPEMTEDALPALQALGMPGVYRGPGTASPSVASNLPTIEVVPQLNGAYTVPLAGQYVLLAASSTPTLEVREASTSRTLPRVALAPRTPDWAAYGPILLGAGRHEVISSAEAGPLVAWSELSKQALSTAASEESITPTNLGAEYVVAPSPVLRTGWVELRRTFDPGWSLGSASHLTGDGLFNLYFDRSATSSLTFSLSTRPAESAGILVSLAWTLGIIGILLAFRKAVPQRDLLQQPTAISFRVPTEGIWRPATGMARNLSLAGIALLILAAASQAIAWYGNVDGYGFAEYLLISATVLLAAATSLHLVSSAVGQEVQAPRKLHEIYNYIGLHSALIDDRLRSQAPTYTPADWSTVLSDLDRIYPGAAKFAVEAEVTRIESHVREKTAGRGTQGPWAQALNSDLALARCLYIICRAMRPTLVIETGVAYGVSSAFILQALAINEHGTLHSIDLPLPGTAADNVTGAVIPGKLRGRWHLHLGSSQRELPRLIDSEGVDLFVHDSLHTYRNMRREFRTVWPHLAPGGVLVSDDVEGNGAFRELLLERPQYWEVVRQDHKQAALFGIAIKRDRQSLARYS